jgi:hypothetical protein
MRIFVLLLLATAYCKPAVACQCGEMPPPDVAVATCDAVFDGILVRRTPVLRRELSLEGSRFLMVFEENEFLVLQSWRAPDKPTVLLLQGATNCSSHFTLQHRYLVFAQSGRELPRHLSSTICLPTAPIEEAASALSQLGPPNRTNPVPTVVTETHLRRFTRHCRASLLFGVAATVLCIESPATVLRQSQPLFLLGPLAVILATCVPTFLAIRRRFRLSILSLLPALMLVGTALLVQGYLLIRTQNMYMLWYLLDITPGGA